jgi:DNA-binding transcriptional ArsR family regulator
MKIEAEAFKVFSVETRIKIIELLKKTPLTVNAMADALGVTQSAVSQHLRILKQAGLVANERDGYHIFYSLDKDGLDKYQQKMSKICSCGNGLVKQSRIAEPKEVSRKCKNRIESELEQLKKRITELEKKR